MTKTEAVLVNDLMNAFRDADASYLWVSYKKHVYHISIEQTGHVFLHNYKISICDEDYKTFFEKESCYKDFIGNAAYDIMNAIQEYEKDREKKND